MAWTVFIRSGFITLQCLLWNIIFCGKSKFNLKRGFFFPWFCLTFCLEHKKSWEQSSKMGISSAWPPQGWDWAKNSSPHLSSTLRGLSSASPWTAGQWWAARKSEQPPGWAAGDSSPSSPCLWSQGFALEQRFVILNILWVSGDQDKNDFPWNNMVGEQNSPNGLGRIHLKECE